jgi:exosome complex component RRP42
MIESSKLTSERIRQYLAEGKRFDGRKPDEFREVTIECGISKKAEGSAKVKIGNTEVWVGVKIDIVAPYSDSPNKGNLMVTAELTPLSHSKYEYGPPKFSAIELGRLVDRGIREAKFIDFEKMCIVEGEKVWNIYIDIYSVNDAGNLLDASFIGALAAIKDAKMPFYDEEKSKIDYDKKTDKKIPLTERAPLNYSVYKVGEKIFFDPVLEEEGASEGRLIVGIVNAKPLKICSMQKSESMALTLEQFNEMLDFIEKKHEKFFKEINEKIDKAIKSNK